MKSVYKYNIMLNTFITYLTIFLFVVISYIIYIPVFTNMIVFSLSYVISLFYIDNRASSNRFLVSLPLSKKTIVKGRYVTIISLNVILVLFQLGISHIVAFFSDIERYIVHWNDMIALICLLMIMSAVIIPLFYFTRSFIFSAICSCFILCIGFFFLLDGLISVLNMKGTIIFNDLDPGLPLLVEKYIPYQPYLILLIVAIIWFYLSMQLSAWLFSKQDI